MENSLKKIPGSIRSTVEKTLIKDNADQGALLGAVSRTGYTRRHFKDLQEERDTPEPPLHSTKITSDRISMNSVTSKPSYLPDGNAVTDHQGSRFTHLDQYIESPFIIAGGDLASEEEPEYNIEVTLAMLRKAIFDFETKFDEKENWPGKVWTTEIELQTQLDEVKDVAMKSGKGELLSICEELQNKLKYAVKGWNKKMEESYQPDPRYLAAAQGSALDQSSFHGFPDTVISNPYPQQVSSLPNSSGISHLISTTPKMGVLALRSINLLGNTDSGEHIVDVQEKPCSAINPPTEFGGEPPCEPFHETIAASSRNFNAAKSKGRCLSIQDELINEGEALQTTDGETSADEEEPDLTEYDRSRGDIPPLNVIIEDILKKQPKFYKKLSSNEKIIIKKCSQLESKIIDIDKTQNCITHINEGLICSSKKNSLDVKDTMAAVNDIDNDVQGLKKKITTLEYANANTERTLAAFEAKFLKRGEAIAILAEQVSKQANIINNLLEEKDKQTELSFLVLKLEKQLDEISVRMKTSEKFNDILSTKLAFVESKSFAVQSPHPLPVPGGNPFPGMYPCGLVSSGVVMTTTTSVPIVTQSNNTNSAQEQLLDSPEIPVSGIRKHNPSRMSSGQAVACPQPGLRTVHEPPKSQKVFNSLGRTVSVSVHHEEQTCRDNHQPSVRQTYTTPPSIFQQERSRSGSGVSRQSIIGAEDEISRDILRDSFQMLVDKLSGMINKNVDDTFSEERIQEYYSSYTPQIEKISKQCNEACMKYSTFPGRDVILCQKAIRIMRNASEWVSNIRDLAENRQSYTKPLGKEFTDSLVPFSNDAKQNVFEFFKKFEASFQRKGTEQQRGEMLSEKYLSPRIRLQTAECHGDYLKIKAFLIRKYGDVMTIANTICDDLESKKKPGPHASFQVTSDFFTLLLSGIYKIRNLAKIQDLDASELNQYIHSRIFLERLVALLPDSHRYEFNKKASDQDLDPQKLVGQEALELLVKFIEREIKGLDSVTQCSPKRPPLVNKEKQTKKSPNKSVNIVKVKDKCPDSDNCFEDDIEDEPSQTIAASILKTGDKTSNSKWYDSSLKYPCPLDNHKHEIGVCAEFFSLTAKERIESCKKKLCFTCLGPWHKCQRKCNGKPPRELLCKECKYTFKGTNKSTYNLLLCPKDDHSKPIVKDIMKILKDYFPSFNMKHDVKLSANILIASFMPSCFKCGQEDVCACNTPTKSSLVDPYAKVPVIDTQTGQEIVVDDNMIVREINEATVFVMQTLKIKDEVFLTFYDRGASQHLINGNMAEKTKLKVISSRPSSLYVVGGGSVSTEYGLYRVALGKTSSGKVHDIICQGMSSITSSFPKFDLTEVNDEVMSLKSKPINSNEPLPLEIGGSEVHLLLGIKDTELEPVLLFTTPLGVGVYRSKLKDINGSSICYGGPHPVFTKLHRLSHGRVNHFMAMFVNSYKNSVYNVISNDEEKFCQGFEDNDERVFISKPKGLVYTIDSHSEMGCKIFPTPLTEGDFIESGCLIEKDEFDDFDRADICYGDLGSYVSLEHGSDTCVSKSVVLEKRNDHLNLLVSDGPSENGMLNRFHYCPVMKARIPLSRLKELLDDPDVNDTVTYRCPECAKCIRCKESTKTKAISLNEKVEQTFIEKSVSIDLENRKVMVDMPFTKDPVEFLTNRHRGPDNYKQALSVYQTQCRKSSTIKDGIRDVHKSLAEKGFMVKLSELSESQKKIIQDAEFQHFFVWRCVYNPGSLSTPIRLVVDPTQTGLNIILAKGEARLGNISDIMLLSRCMEMIWISDISKLYNQLKLNDASLPYSLFLYSDSLDPSVKPEVWVMTSAWYGVGSSGGQAEAALRMIARLDTETFPLAVKPLEEGRYVDDLRGVSHTSDERELQIQQTRQALSLGGLSMKFVAKSGEPPPPEASSDGISTKLLGYRWEPVKDILTPGFSELNFHSKVRGAKKPNSKPIITKEDARELMNDLVVTRKIVISKLAEFWDPIGIWEPFKVQLKLAASLLNGLDWNKPLPNETQEYWKEVFLKFTEFQCMAVPRCTIPPEVMSASKIRLLCISDAAVHAGGSAIYATYRKDDGSYSCRLLKSKSRILDGTVPSNELSAIMIMAELAFTVKKALGNLVGEILYFTDSTIAMCWSFNTNKKLRIYVLNRVNLIRQMIEWTTGETENLPLYHIDGELNPADLLTKTHDIGPTDLTVDSVWQSGLPWMRLPLDSMPVKTYADLRIDAKVQQEVEQECFHEPFIPKINGFIHAMFDQKLGQTRSVSHCSGCQSAGPLMKEWICYGRFDEYDHCDDCDCNFVFSASSKGRQAVYDLPVDVIHFGWQKSLNFMSRALEFICKVTHRAHRSTENPIVKSNLKKICILCVTQDDKLNDVLRIEAENYLFRSNSKTTISRLSGKQLKEFVIHNSILWYTGRLSEINKVKTSDLDISCFFDNVNIKSVVPVLCADSPLFYSFAMHVHTKLCPHSGVESTMREVSKMMHVINNPRRVIQQIRKDCTRCRLNQRKTMELEMAQHHEARTTLTPPFYNCMADIAYGFKAKPYYGARKEYKIYALVIVCVLTSATNILVLEGLQTQNVIQALERHSSRFGTPSRIFVDNGAQLVSLQNNTDFSLRDVNQHVYESMSMQIEVSSAKSHESRGRVEAKVKILRSMLTKLAIDTRTAMTALQWETCFSTIANQIDDLPMAKGHTSNVSDIGWDIITPNRLKLGRNNFRSLSGPISLTGGSGMDDLLQANRDIQKTWYQMFLDRLHHLILKPRKWLVSDIPNVDDIVLFIYLDGQKSKNEAVWKIGKIIKIHSSNRKVTIAFPARVSPTRLPTLRTINRGIREISVIFSVKDLAINTTEHYRKCISKHGVSSSSS